MHLITHYPAIWPTGAVQDGKWVINSFLSAVELKERNFEKRRHYHTHTHTHEHKFLLKIESLEEIINYNSWYIQYTYMNLPD